MFPSDDAPSPSPVKRPVRRSGARRFSGPPRGDLAFERAARAAAKDADVSPNNARSRRSSWGAGSPSPRKRSDNRRRYNSNDSDGDCDDDDNSGFGGGGPRPSVKWGQHSSVWSRQHQQQQQASQRNRDRDRDRDRDDDDDDDDHAPSFRRRRNSSPASISSPRGKQQQQDRKRDDRADRDEGESKRADSREPGRRGGRGRGRSHSNRSHYVSSNGSNGSDSGSDHGGDDESNRRNNSRRRRQNDSPPPARRCDSPAAVVARASSPAASDASTPRSPPATSSASGESGGSGGAAGDARASGASSSTASSSPESAVSGASGDAAGACASAADRDGGEGKACEDDDGPATANWWSRRAKKARSALLTAGPTPLTAGCTVEDLRTVGGGGKALRKYPGGMVRCMVVRYKDESEMFGGRGGAAGAAKRSKKKAKNKRGRRPSFTGMLNKAMGAAVGQVCFEMYIQEATATGGTKPRLIMAAKRKVTSRTGNFQVFDLSKGRPFGGKLSKKHGNFVGKLRSNFMKTEHAIYSQEGGIKRQLGLVLFDKATLREKIQDGVQPRKVTVVVPAVGDAGHVLGRVEGDGDGLKARLERARDTASVGGTNRSARAKGGGRDDYDAREAVVAMVNQPPVYERGNYRLNFFGRVTVPSVKNFQLIQDTKVTTARGVAEKGLLMQFGKIGEDRFHLDFREPLTPFQAFTIALCQFNF